MHRMLALLTLTVAFVASQSVDKDVVLLVSQGGEASLRLVNALSSSLQRAGLITNSPTDQDNLLHRWFGASFAELKRQDILRSVRCAVYLYEDPATVLETVIDRQALYDMAQRMRVTLPQIDSPSYQLLRNKRTTVEDVAISMTDILEIESHFDSWLEAATTDAPFPIAFLPVFEAWKYMEELEEFVGLNESALANTDLNEISVESRLDADVTKYFSEIFLSLQMKYESLDGFETMQQLDKPEVIVVSVGGEGTTSFIQALQTAGARTNNIWDLDGLKHRWYEAEMELLRQRHSALFPANDIKFIYIWDDPTHAVGSLLRRGWLWDQAEKTRQRMPQRGTRLYELLTKPDLQLDEVADAGVDILDIGNHFTGWVSAANSTSPFPVMFLRSSSRWKYMDEVARFVGLDSSRIPQWSRKAHTAKHTEMSDSTKQKLESLYKDVKVMQGVMGDITVFNRGNGAKQQAEMDVVVPDMDEKL